MIARAYVSLQPGHRAGLPAFPGVVMALTTRTVVGTYLYDDLTPASGDVTFVPNASLTSSANTTLVPTSAVTAQLSTTGAFTITLVCTDNAGVSPTGWAYTVTERIKGQTQRSYTINVPAGVGSLDLSTVTPLETAPTLVTYLLAANNLSDVASAATARTNLGLTAAATATLPLAIASGGTGQTTASTALSALGGVASTRSVAAGTGLTGGGDLSADRTISASLGATGDIAGLGTAAAGSTGKVADAGHVHSSTITGSPLTVTDGSTKQYRFRTSGSSLDFDAAGTDMFLSVFNTYAFGGTQYTYARFESGAQLLHLVGTVQFATGPFASAGVTIDPATASIGSAGKNGIDPINIVGRKSTAGAPASGTWATGDAVLDSAGTWHYCTSGGTPGTWA